MTDAAPAASAAELDTAGELEETWEATYTPPWVRDYGRLEPAFAHPVQLP